MHLIPRDFESPGQIGDILASVHFQLRQEPVEAVASQTLLVWEVVAAPPSQAAKKQRTMNKISPIQGCLGLGSVTCCTSFWWMSLAYRSQDADRQCDDGQGNDET